MHDTATQNAYVREGITYVMLCSLARGAMARCVLLQALLRQQL
jgi:hypothetical protein